MAEREHLPFHGRTSEVLRFNARSTHSSKLFFNAWAKICVVLRRKVNLELVLTFVL